MEILQWLIDNIEPIVAGATGILAGIAVICKLTPTPKDDALVAKILEFLNLLPKK